MVYKIQTQNSAGAWEIYKTIEIDDSYGETHSDFEWDSRTGLITAYNTTTKTREVIPCAEGSENLLGTLPPGPIQTEGISYLEYNYIYY